MGKIVNTILRLWRSIPASVKSLGLSVLLKLINNKQEPEAPIITTDNVEKPVTMKKDKIAEDPLIELIADFEGCNLKAYKDAVGKWTIGFGNTYYLDGRKVQEGDEITYDEAVELLKSTVNTYKNSVIRSINVKLNTNQINALTSFAYNLGVGYFKNSTLFKMVNADPNDPKIAEQFLKYRNAGGRYLRGLLLRRLSEAKLYFS